MLNSYNVTFIDFEEEVSKIVIIIEQTVNRPNNPSDEEIINDYMLVNYGMYSDDFEAQEIEHVYIGERYQVEI